MLQAKGLVLVDVKYGKPHRFPSVRYILASRA
jgi:hypothetical protein